MNNTSTKERFIKTLNTAGLNDRIIKIITYELNKNIKNKTFNDGFSSIWESFIYDTSEYFTKTFSLNSNIFLTCIYTSLLYGYTVIRRNNKFKIVVNVLLKLIHNYLINFDISPSMLKKFLKEILKNLGIYMNLYKTKININDTWDSWVVDINNTDIKIILSNDIKNSYISYDNLKKWIYINERCVNICVDGIDNVTNTLLTTGKFLQDNHIYDLYNEKLINIINNLQKDYYKIDIELFINIFTSINLKDYINELYRKDFILKIYNYYEHIINNIDNYKSSHMWYTDEEFEIKFLKYIQENIFSNKFIYEDDNDMIDISIITLLQYLYKHDSNNKVYTYLFIDYRGRLNVKGNISYVSSKLLRFIINFDKDMYENVEYNDFTKYYLLSQMINTRQININDGIIKYDSIISNFKIENIESLIKKVNFKKIYNNIGNTISLDATASMMQIIGTLTSNTKLMLYTNLINNEDKKDIYDHIISIILENVEKNSTFYNCYNNRSLVKYSLMLYTYGSTPLFTAKKIIDDKDVNNIHIKDLTMIITKIINTFNNEFPVVKILKSIVNKHVRKNKSCDNLKYRTILKKINYSIPKSNKIDVKYNNINIKFINLSKDTDIKKMWKSAFVNIIHSLDSDICILTRKKLMDDYKISSVSIHDCFIVNINNYEKCLLTYNKAIAKILEIDISWILKDIDVKDYNKLSKYNDYDFNKNSIERCKYSLKPE